MTEPSLEQIQSTGYGDRQLLLEQSQATPELAQQPFIGLDEVPNLSDASSRPDEPVTAGMDTGMGDSSEVLGPVAQDPVRQTLQSMLLVNPNNDVQRMIDMLDAMGG